jgi:hypothetical protein
LEQLASPLGGFLVRQFLQLELAHELSLPLFLLLDHLEQLLLVKRHSTSLVTL